MSVAFSDGDGLLLSPPTIVPPALHHSPTTEHNSKSQIQNPLTTPGVHVCSLLNNGDGILPHGLPRTPGVAGRAPCGAGGQDDERPQRPRHHPVCKQRPHHRHRRERFENSKLRTHQLFVLVGYDNLLRGVQPAPIDHCPSRRAAAHARLVRPPSLPPSSVPQLRAPPLADVTRLVARPQVQHTLREPPDSKRSMAKAIYVSFGLTMVGKQPPACVTV